MPVYEYVCEDHGAFEMLRPMSQHAEPCDCPVCGASAPRALLTAPRLGARDQSRMMAHEVNERSSHEPRRASSHGAGCACCGPSRLKKEKTAPPAAAKSFPTKRPWMISH
jgi:putative FmdB family regulatory protein